MNSLRNKVIKLAYEKPELREDLLPLVKKSYDWSRVEILNLYSMAKRDGMSDEDALDQIEYRTKMQRHIIIDELYEKGVDLKHLRFQ